ncbi:Putative sgc region protein SgcQ [Planctomycetes bacterium Pla163]|uniref:Sgc region protein SgcQ n=1 Tax=Rohdeia mirabilis TaxID=2528008 RepID=A0A518CZ01_9BACT|nr:Putative sgc region protein SgcQ [Planctomycetes bacterium Pla163]
MSESSMVPGERIPPTWSKRAVGHRALVGVVHLRALPGSPGCGAASGARPLDEVLRLAVADARALAEGGVDAIVVENFGDTPFFAERVPPETVAAMTLATEAVRAAVGGDLAIGVNVLRNDVRSALAIAAATGAAFVRVNVHVGTAVTDQGIVNGRAARTLRARAALVPGCAIWADVHVKHAVPLGGGEIGDAARETFERGRADGLIVSGVATGSAPDPGDLERVRSAVPVAPLLIGSGLTLENAADLCRFADGAICGTALKVGGDVGAPVDPARVVRMRAVLDGLGD